MFEEFEPLLQRRLDEMIHAVQGGDLERLLLETESLRETALSANCEDLVAATERLREAIEAEAPTAEIRGAVGTIIGVSEEMASPYSIATVTEPPPPITSSLPLEDPDFLRIVSGFVEHLQCQLLRMRSVWEAGELEEVARLAHWLKGAGGTLGFDVFTEPAKRLQGLAQAGQFEEIEPAIEELIQMAARIEIPESASA